MSFSFPSHFLFISSSFPDMFFHFLFMFFSFSFHVLFTFPLEKGGGVIHQRWTLQRHNMAQLVFIFLTTSDILVAVIEPLPVQSPHRPLVTHLHHPAVSLSLFSQVLLLSPGLRTVPSGLAEGRPQTMWERCTASHAPRTSWWLEALSFILVMWNTRYKT